jgi:hypothetical protein
MALMWCARVRVFAYENGLIKPGEVPTAEPR